ncbi:guanine deaminase [Entomortierella parvispora]|uniref:Guanine deaminase n=1 Tax=Entomortierella parvispora TaxID=205924 RepID=A0A9P3HHY8_9FUNG|nr:guanine deaminase [Entomortierella parvispora]
MTIAQAFYGTFVHAPTTKQLVFLKNTVLVLDRHGKIVSITPDQSLEQAQAAFRALENSKTTVLNDNQFFVPGYIDTHIHAPQYAYCGIGHDMPLLKWLNTLTFPQEAMFQDHHYARQVYTKAVARSLRNGTTAACWFATIHLEATKELVKAIQEQGQRAYIGKVNMNQNSPDILIETTAASIADTRAFIEYVQAVNRTMDPDSTSVSPPLIQPIITPRFALSCTSDLMIQLGKLSEEFKIPIQSHLCENLEEIDLTLSQFPNSTTYTGVYADHGLLKERTIMAHCVHMKDEEFKLMKDAGASISHCAGSNFNIKSGMADVRKMLDLDIKVGLGTDVAGGYSPSILDAIRTSRICSIARNPTQSLLIPELFYLATLGGAKVMGLGETIGSFEVGKDFDAVLVNTAVKNSPLDSFGRDTVQTKFEKYLFVGDDRNHERIFIQGREARLPE